MDKNSKKMFSGAFILGVAAFFSKFLGAVYRIPLTKIIGVTGLGLYQTVFPVYTLLLDFSGAAVPNAVAKIISSYRGTERDEYAQKILKTGLLFFSSLGALFSVFTAVFSDYIASAQGNADVSLAYRYLSPSVFIVCVICCFRGYFQGFMNMTHTALSQIIEQTVKLGAGLLLAGAFMPDVKKAGAGAALAITVSELVALSGLIIAYVLHKKKRNLPRVLYDVNFFRRSIKDIFFYALPITVTGLALPLSKVIDSFIIVNFISKYSTEATSLYGLYSGVAVTVIGLPVAVCYGISAVSVPFLSASRENNKNKNAFKTILLTLIVSLPCAVAFALFAPLIINILFGYLVEKDKIIAIELLRISTPAIVFLSLLQTLNGILIGKGNPKKPIIGLSAGVALKIIIEVFTLKIPEINIYGVAVASIACYFIADLVNLSLVFPIKTKRQKDESLPVKGRLYADQK